MTERNFDPHQQPELYAFDSESQEAKQIKEVIGFTNMLAEELIGKQVFLIEQSESGTEQVIQNPEVSAEEFARFAKAVGYDGKIF